MYDLSCASAPIPSIPSGPAAWRCSPLGRCCRPSLACPRRRVLPPKAEACPCPPGLMGSSPEGERPGPQPGIQGLSTLSFGQQHTRTPTAPTRVTTCYQLLLKLIPTRPCAGYTQPSGEAATLKKLLLSTLTYRPFTSAEMPAIPSSHVACVTEVKLSTQFCDPAAPWGLQE